MITASYLNLSEKELNQRAELLFGILENCRICPRKCGVNRRKEKTGFCKLGEKPKVSSYFPHFGEEACLVGRYDPVSKFSFSKAGGSGTIFFTSCNLACVFCQNYEISQLRKGQEVSFKELAQMMLELQDRGCHNINLVTPTCQIPSIVKSLNIAYKQGLNLPLIYNTNAYDLPRTLKILEGIIDIYMPDFKYSEDEMAQKYSQAPHYFEIAQKALLEMHRQVGDLVIDQKGIAQRGLLVRHLVLPHGLGGTKKIVEFIAQKISKDTFFNLMDQYFPAFKASKYPELSRKITSKEYSQAVKLAKEAGLKRLI